LIITTIPWYMPKLRDIHEHLDLSYETNTTLLVTPRQTLSAKDAINSVLHHNSVRIGIVASSLLLVDVVYSDAYICWLTMYLRSCRLDCMVYCSDCIILKAFFDYLPDTFLSRYQSLHRLRLYIRLSVQ